MWKADLIVGHMAEQIGSGDIATGIDALGRSLQILIDDNPALRFNVDRR